MLPVLSLFQGALRCRRGPVLHIPPRAPRCQPPPPPLASSSRVSRDAARRRWSTRSSSPSSPTPRATPARSRPRPRPRRTPCSKRVGSRDPRALEARRPRASPGSRRPTSRSPRRNETRSSRTRAVAPPRRVSRASGGGCSRRARHEGHHPRRGSAETRRVRRARLRHLRRRGGDPLAAPTRASGARAVPRAPAPRRRRRGRSADPESSAESSTESSSSGAPRAAPAATASLTTRDLGRVAAVLGVRPSDVPTALRDGSKPYLPTRFVALLGRTRVCEFFATKRTERPAKRKRGRPRKNEEREKNDGRETTADLTPAVVAAVRAHLCRVAHGDWSRWGLIASDVVVELPMTTKAGIEMAVCDVPGAPRTGSPWRNAHSRAHLVRALASAPLDALVSVCDGGPGPSRELRGAMRESGALDTMVSDDGGGVLVLAWPLDKIASHDPSVTLDPNAYAAMQTKLAERGQGSDAADDDSASDHHRNTYDEDNNDSDDSDDYDDVDSGLDSGTARRPRLLSRGGADESWTRCLARAAGRNGGVVRGAMSSQPVHTFFGAVELEAPTSGLKPVPKRRRVQGFVRVVGGVPRGTRGDALERRRRPRDEGRRRPRVGGAREGGGHRRRPRRRDGDRRRRVDPVATSRVSSASFPSSTAAAATAASRLTAREPLRDVSAELGRNAERSLKPPVLKPRRGAPGPLEAAALRAGGIAAGRGAEASERRVRFTSSVLGGTSADDGAEEVGKSVPVDEGASNVGQKYRSGGNRPRDLFSGDAPVVPWWERKL